MSTPNETLSNALRALAEVGAVHPAGEHNDHVTLIGEEPVNDEQQGWLAPCGSPHCAGCYTVPGGARIHPPRTSAEWLAWEEDWRRRGGRVQ